MGLFDYIFKKKSDRLVGEYFKMLSGYTPVFTTYAGGVYGCKMCPLYNEERKTLTQQGLCQEKLTTDNLRKAVETLRGNWE